MAVTSESVWFEEVNTSLVSYIKSIVKLPNSSGVLVSVPVEIRKPDKDFRIEHYPCISVYNLYSRKDDVRFFSGNVVVSQNEEEKTLVVERGAIPYSLTYQIDFWTTLQTDMDEMTRLWFGAHPDKDFNLSVLDKSGKSRRCYVLQRDNNLVKSDYVEGIKRIFQSSATYVFSVELDEKIQKEVPMITDIVIT